MSWAAFDLRDFSRATPFRVALPRRAAWIATSCCVDVIGTAADGPASIVFR